jgi:hypothetical protein
VLVRLDIIGGLQPEFSLHVLEYVG